VVPGSRPIGSPDPMSAENLVEYSRAAIFRNILSDSASVPHHLRNERLDGLADGGPFINQNDKCFGTA
jgi:hypothetical protein